jgi:hypothetical protein
LRLYSIFGKALPNTVVFFHNCQFWTKYTLQISAYSQKHSPYSCEALKSKSIIKKGFQKKEKALGKHSKSLLFSIFQVCCRSIFNQNPTL